MFEAYFALFCERYSEGYVIREEKEFQEGYLPALIAAPRSGHLEVGEVWGHEELGAEWNTRARLEEGPVFFLEGRLSRSGSAAIHHVDKTFGLLSEMKISDV